jgi:quinol monooxygenase YgiN
MTRRRLVGALGVGAVVGTMAVVSSMSGMVGRAQQAPERSEMLHVTFAKVKPERWIDFLDFQRNESVAVQQKAGTAWRAVWASGIFAEGFSVAMVTPIAKMAQYDGQGPAMRVLGEDGARAYNTTLREMVESTRSVLIRTRPDLSYVPQPAMMPKFAVVATVSVVPGRTADFEAVIKSDVLPAMKRAGIARYAVSQTVLGGDVNEYTTLAYFDHYADMDQPWGLEKALGADGMLKLGQKFSGIIAHHERMIVRYVPEASFQPDAPPSAP